jgi:hypothetical protein
MRFPPLLGRSLRALACAGLVAALALPASAGALAAAALPQKVTGPEISMLVRTTIVALHQANLTANYSVLRDLGDRQFQAAYSQAALADMFRSFRERAINLAPAVLFDADLDGQPRLTEDGLLRVVGHFATAPQQIVFDLTFRSEGGIWRIDAINAGTRAAPLMGSLPMPPPVPRPRPAAGPEPASFRFPTDIALPFPAQMDEADRARGVVDVSDNGSNYQ